MDTITMPQLTEKQFNELCDKHNVDKYDAFHHPHIQDILLCGEDDIIQCIEYVFNQEF